MFIASRTHKHADEDARAGRLRDLRASHSALSVSGVASMDQKAFCIQLTTTPFAKMAALQLPLSRCYARFYFSVYFRWF